LTALIQGTIIFLDYWVSIFFGYNEAMKKKTLIIGTTATPTHADSEFGNSYVDSQLYTNMNDPLIRYKAIPLVIQNKPKNLLVTTDDEKTFLPNLCESWELSSDHTSIRINLRKGQLSHGNNELSTADTRYTVERSFAVRASIFYWLNSFMGLPSPDYLHLLDNYSFEFITPRPTGVALKLLSSPWIAHLDQKTARQHSSDNDPWSMKWLARNSSGWGPYQIKEWENGKFVKLTACEKYWRGKAPMDTVILKAVPDRSTRIKMLENGDIDIAERLLPRDIEYLRGKESINVMSTPSTGVYQLIMNCQQKPFSDVKVRHAMNYACPQDKIIQRVFRGMAEPMKSPCSPAQPGFTDESWEYDYNPDKAAQLLHDAGYPKGFSVELAYTDSSPAEEEVCLIIQDSLSKLGIEIKLNKLPLSVFNEKLYKKEHLFASKFTFTAVRDPSYWALWYKSNTILNYHDLQDTELDRLIDKQSKIMDAESRAKFSKKIQKRIMDLAPVVFISYPMMNNALRSDIGGSYHVNPDCLSYYWYDLNKD
jgi:peptide/nickel transport system substrate-binding protein